MQQSCFPCIPLFLETVFQNKSDSSRLELIILGERTLEFLWCAVFMPWLRAGQSSRIGRAELSAGDLSLQTKLSHQPQLAAFPDTADSQGRAHCPGTASSTHPEIPGFPCLSGDFPKETISSARISAEEAPVGSRAGFYCLSQCTKTSECELWLLKLGEEELLLQCLR